ncbi:MAG: hypothetical protein PUB10_07010 [Clostridiales bacterium]|nr:hypothetical protein [Clostridiales bacterium]
MKLFYRMAGVLLAGILIFESSVSVCAAGLSGKNVTKKIAYKTCTGIKASNIWGMESNEKYTMVLGFNDPYSYLYTKDGKVKVMLSYTKDGVKFANKDLTPYIKKLSGNKGHGVAQEDKVDVGSICELDGTFYILGTYKSSLSAEGKKGHQLYILATKDGVHIKSYVTKNITDFSNQAKLYKMGSTFVLFTNTNGKESGYKIYLSKNLKSWTAYTKPEKGAILNDFSLAVSGDEAVVKCYTYDAKYKQHYAYYKTTDFKTYVPVSFQSGTNDNYAKVYALEEEKGFLFCTELGIKDSKKQKITMYGMEAGKEEPESEAVVRKLYSYTSKKTDWWGSFAGKNYFILNVAGNAYLSSDNGATYTKYSTNLDFNQLKTSDDCSSGTLSVCTYGSTKNELLLSTDNFKHYYKVKGPSSYMYLVSYHKKTNKILIGATDYRGAYQMYSISASALKKYMK